MKEYQPRLLGSEFSDNHSPREGSCDVDQNLLEICQDTFGRVQRIWNNLGLELPQTEPQYGSFDQINSFYPDHPLRPSLGLGYGQSRELRHDLPRICDLEIPETFKPFIENFVELSKYKTKSFLVDDIYDMCRMQNLDSEDVVGLLEDEEAFYGWVWEEVKKWRDKYYDLDTAIRFRGRDVQIGLGLNDRTYFDFDRNRNLRGYRDYSMLDTQLPTNKTESRHLQTRASFRNESLVSLWIEVPNGTFFPDPKGEQDQIWPVWLKPDFLELHDSDPKAAYLPSNEDHWNEYLDRIRRGEKVVSGRTLKLVRQTEEQARSNLERWRDWAYNFRPQAFHFYREGSVRQFGEVGYARFGRYGYHVVKNPISYRVLDPEEIQESLISWQPELKTDLTLAS